MADPETRGVEADRTHEPSAGEKGGRPRIEFNLDDVKRIIERGNRIDDLAHILGVHKSTIEKRQQSDPEFKAAVEAGRAVLRDRLNTAQVRAALGGNPTMMIWCGKQHLGQRDFKSVELSGPEGGPLQVETDVAPELEAKLLDFLRSRRSTT